METLLLARITRAKKTKGRVVAEEFHCIRRGWRRAGGGGGGGQTVAPMPLSARDVSFQTLV